MRTSKSNLLCVACLALSFAVQGQPPFLAELLSEQARLTVGDVREPNGFGSSVAVNEGTLVVGAVGKDQEQGAAYVFARSGSKWVLQAELRSSDGTPKDSFGSTVALNGETLVVGAPGKDEERGAAYVFVRSGTEWAQQARLLLSDAEAYDGFGQSLALDGDTLVVAAPGRDEYRGTVRVFTRSGTNWTQQAEVMTSDGPGEVGDWFGGSVVLSGDTLVVAAPYKESKGAAYVFIRSDSNWVQQAKVQAGDGEDANYFGGAMALEGETLVVGDPTKDESRGTVYVFARSGTNWIQQAELMRSDGSDEADDRFGAVVALSGETLVVGQAGGAANVFVRSEGSWVQQARVQAGDGRGDSYHGWPLALKGDTLAVGNSDWDRFEGAAYVFERSGTRWAEQAQLFAPGGTKTDLFGRALALDGSTLVVGDAKGQGAAYVFTHQGQAWSWPTPVRLSASDGATDDAFGHSVAVSGDTVAVGAPGVDRRRGAVYVFVRSGTEWLEQARLTAGDGVDFDAFGQAVAVNGNTLVVGACYHGTGRGAAYVFVREGSIWTSQAKLLASDGAAPDYFGWAVALDGDAILVGAKGEAEGRGAAYVFARSGTNWQQQPKLLADDGTARDAFGCAVALSGTNATVGACGKDGSLGAAYVFIRVGANWVYQARLQASDGAAGDRFGCSVAVSADTVVAGASGKDGQGVVYAFVRSGSAWLQQARLGPAEDSYGYVQFGGAVSLSGDTIVAGADGRQERRGAGYVFARSDGTWRPMDQVGVVEGRDTQQFGGSVALDGDTLLVGVGQSWSGSDSYSMAAYVFVRSGTNWVRQAKLLPSDGMAGDLFGWPVALSGDTAAVGAPHRDGGKGAVYVFVRSGTNWFPQARLVASDGAADDSFGAALALSGEKLVVGAPDQNSWHGAAYVFVRSGTNWAQQSKLIAGDSGGYHFGCSVAVSTNTVLVGAYYTETPGDPYDPWGAAYVFVGSGTVWSHQATLRASDGANADYFGWSVALDGNTALVGAPQKEYAAGADHYKGAAYVFERSGTTWTQKSKLLASDGENYDWFGWSVALNGEALVVGTIAQNSEGTDFVYLFTRSGTGWREEVKLSPRGDSDGFGSAVALDGETVVAGARREGNGAAYVFTPGYGNPAGLASYTRKLLYLRDAAASPWFDPYQAAFRYKDLLYANTNGSLRAQFEKMSPLYYGDSERQRAKEAEDLLKGGLAHNPDSDLLGHLLLDLYYDRAVAEAFFARDASTNLTYFRFLRPIPPNRFLIDDEIAACNTVLELNRRALTNYVTLFNDTCGVPGPTPLGCQVFQRLVPLRGLAPATYTNASGQPVSVTGSTNLLFTGYKDLVLLYDLLQEYGLTAVELARLRIANGEGEETILGLFTDTHRFLTLHSTLWRGLFPNLALPPDDPSGLAQAMAGVNDCLDDLETLKQGLRGKLNPLGFARDFLMFVQKTGDTFDSFDVLKSMLDPIVMEFGPLGDAISKLDDAVDHYDEYRGYQDDLAAQFADSSITYMDRLRDIVGVFPDDPRYTDDPTAHPGSDLNQQYLSIEQARLQILHNSTEIENLKRQVEIELWRVGAVTSAYIRYGDERASVMEEIGRIKAAQAAADAAAQAVSDAISSYGVSLVAGAVNAGLQYAAEEKIGQKEAEIERLSAKQDAEIEGLESQARIKTWLLEMNTLSVESQEAMLALQQEMNRLQGLYREKRDLERKLAQRDARLAQRYFADPIHQLRVQSGMVRADQAFVRAQRWLFFMARALEYKWNQPFAGFSYDSKTWSSDTLFKLRNAEELFDFYGAMCEWEWPIQSTVPKAYRWDWFSVRDDFFGYRAGTNASGQPRLYPDPQTGQWLSATDAFRTNLVRRLRSVSGGQEIVLEFDTVREIPAGFFFVGPTFDTDGHVIPGGEGRYLDKIDYLKIRLLGNHTLGFSQLAGRLTYGGTSFIRKQQVGQFDPTRPDRLQDELTAYGTRYWYNLGQGWRFKDALTVSDAFMELSANPDVPPETAEINEFQERSVAATGWVLAIPVVARATQVLNINELDDIKIYFRHYSAQRLE